MFTIERRRKLHKNFPSNLMLSMEIAAISSEKKKHNGGILVETLLREKKLARSFIDNSIQLFPAAAFFLASEISLSARASFSNSTALAFNRPSGVFDHLKVITN